MCNNSDGCSSVVASSNGHQPIDQQQQQQLYDHLLRTIAISVQAACMLVALLLTFLVFRYRKYKVPTARYMTALCFTFGILLKWGVNMKKFPGLANIASTLLASSPSNIACGALTTAETFMIGITHDCVLPFPDCWFSVRLSRFVYSPRYWQPTTIRVCRNIWESPLSPLSVIVISKENRNEMGSHEQVLPVRLSFIGDVDDAHPPFFPSFFLVSFLLLRLASHHSLSSLSIRPDSI